MTMLSVVMVTHGAREWAERALEAVAAHTDVAHEVIVVDNASPDGTAEMVRERFPEVRLLANEENAGYGAANNQAAGAARGDVLALLNSDALVPAGWAAPLLARLQRAGVGAVVPLLTNLDGSVQTAGAVVGADGSVLALGDGADPADPFYAFERACDFGAGACLLVRRDDFLAAGGFDPVYDPAYFEDADLCLTLAARGLRTVLVPEVQVAHAQFASSDPEAAEALFLRNQAPFRERWADTLRRDHLPTVLPAHPARVLAARDATTAGRVLVLCGEALPEPGSLESGMLGALCDPARELRVTVLADGGDGPAWSARGAEVMTGADPGAVLRDRAGHYDVVVGDVEPLTGVLRRFQPQALTATSIAQATRLVDTLVAPAR